MSIVLGTVVRTVYDCAAGTGGFLSSAIEQVAEIAFYLGAALSLGPLGHRLATALAAC